MAPYEQHCEGFVLWENIASGVFMCTRARVHVLTHVGALFLGLGLAGSGVWTAISGYRGALGLVGCGCRVVPPLSCCQRRFGKAMGNVSSVPLLLYTVASF